VKQFSQIIGVAYDDLRKMDNPVPLVANYYKSKLKPGESLWWTGDNTESAAPMTVRLWTGLSPVEKKKLTVQGYVLFPEVVSGQSTTKYNRYALWLATQQSVVNTNIRDSFSAGGAVQMETSSGTIVTMPAVFGRICKYSGMIVDTLYRLHSLWLELKLRLSLLL
jgi:hypothetical protein